MNRTEFLLDKLAEEAAEVAQAAIKHKHKSTRKSRARLSAEIGDLLAMIALVGIEGCTSKSTASTVLDARMRSTRIKMKDLKR